MFSKTGYDSVYRGIKRISPLINLLINDDLLDPDGKDRHKQFGHFVIVRSTGVVN